MECFVAHITVQEEGFLCCTRAKFTKLAIQAFPIWLKPSY